MGKMMSFIARGVRLSLLSVISAIFVGCVGQSDIACSVFSDKVPPKWLEKTPFEMGLSQDFYYGQGSSSNDESYQKRRKEAIKSAQADLAQIVSVEIFSRHITQNINNETRVQAVAKAISQVKAENIELISQWHDKNDCSTHVLVRVSKKKAAKWERLAQSHFTQRPGLGRVRRPDFEIHAINYRKIGKPPLWITWQKSASPKIQNLYLLIEGALYQAFEKSDIRIAQSRQDARKILHLVALAPSSSAVRSRLDNITIQAILTDKNNDKPIAKAIQSGNDIQTIANHIGRDILRLWLKD